MSVTTKSADTIRRAPRNNVPYFMLARCTAQDTRISLCALGLLTYLLSKPDNWEINMEELQRTWQIGRDKCRGILNELINAGYIQEKQRIETDDGKFRYTPYLVNELPFTEKPFTDEPFTGKPYTGEPSTGNQAPLHNTEEQNTEKQSTEKKEVKEPARVGAGGPQKTESKKPLSSKEKKKPLEKPKTVQDTRNGAQGHHNTQTSVQKPDSTPFGGKYTDLQRVVAAIWPHSRALGSAQNCWLVEMLLGIAKRNGYKDANVNPPCDEQELRDWQRWYQENNPGKLIDWMVQPVSNLQSSILAYRAERTVKPIAVAEKQPAELGDVKEVYVPWINLEAVEEMLAADETLR